MRPETGPCVSEEEGEKYEFALDPETDQELIDALEAADGKGRLEQQILNYLRLGHSVHLAATFQTSQESMKTLTSPLDTRIESLETLIDGFKGSFIGSATSGSIGEVVVRDHLRAGFQSKGDKFEIISSQGHTGDISATMAIEQSPGNVSAVPAMVEAKFYDNPVGQAEVDKFWDDLKENKFEFGMFVSLDQEIVNQEQCIHIEVRDGCYGVLVYNEGYDQLRHLVAWAMLREIARLALSGKHVSPAVNESMQGLVENLDGHLKLMRNALSTIGEIERASTKILDVTAKQVSTIQNSSGSLRKQIDLGIGAMEREIQRVSNEIEGGQQRALDWHYDAFIPLMDALNEKDHGALNALRPELQSVSERFDVTIESDDSKVTLTPKDGGTSKSVILDSMSSSLRISITSEELDEEDVKEVGGKAGASPLNIDIKRAKKDFVNYNFAAIGRLIASVFAAEEE